MVRPEELFAFEVMRRVLEVDVEPHDDGTVDRMADGRFVHPDGRPGVVEVTTLADSRAVELEQLMFGVDRWVPGSRWAWLVTIGDGVRLRDLESHLPALAHACEAAGVTDASELVSTSDSTRAAVDWLARTNVRVRGFPENSRPGVVHLIPEASASWVDTTLSSLPDWIDQVLRTATTMRQHVDKLQAVDVAHRHLFLRLHDSGVPTELSFAIGTEGVVPTRGLDPPDGITAVWIAPRWAGRAVLLWQDNAGWSLHDVYDER